MSEGVELQGPSLRTCSARDLGLPAAHRGQAPANRRSTRRKQASSGLARTAPFVGVRQGCALAFLCGPASPRGVVGGSRGRPEWQPDWEGHPAALWVAGGRVLSLGSAGPASRSRLMSGGVADAPCMSMPQLVCWPLAEGGPHSCGADRVRSGRRGAACADPAVTPWTTCWRRVR